jgi:oxygen-dependent protoporphyrinogen oxidase
LGATRQKRILIAGAGISGLALAWSLRRYGIAAEVFEASTRAGGKLQSDRSEGFLVEWGPASFGFRDPAAAALVSQLGLEEQLIAVSSAARRRGVVVGDAVMPVPISPLSFARSRVGTARAKARLLADLALPKGPTSHGEDESVAEFGRRRFGEVGAERFFFPLVSGLYSGDPEVLSLPSAFPSLARMEREHRSVLLGALSVVRRAMLGPRLASFCDGMRTLPEALARRLGDDVHLGVAVVSIKSSGSGWRVGLQRGGERSEVEADAVALTIPSHAASPVLQTVDLSLASIVGRISYAPVAMVHLGYRRDDLPRLPQAYGFYTPSSEPCALLGAVFMSVLFPSHAPAGHSLIACRMGGAREPDLLGRSDEELVASAHQELARLLGARGLPSFHRVIRHPRALPQYTLGHGERVASIDAAIGRRPGLFLSGNAYRGLGILDCLRQADLTAQRIAEHLSWPFPSEPLEIRRQL